MGLPLACDLTVVTSNVDVTDLIDKFNEATSRRRLRTDCGPLLSMMVKLIARRQQAGSTTVFVRTPPDEKSARAVGLQLLRRALKSATPTAVKALPAECGMAFVLLRDASGAPIVSDIRRAAAEEFRRQCLREWQQSDSQSTLATAGAADLWHDLRGELAADRCGWLLRMICNVAHWYDHRTDSGGREPVEADCPDCNVVADTEHMLVCKASSWRSDAAARLVDEWTAAGGEAAKVADSVPENAELLDTVRTLLPTESKQDNKLVLLAGAWTNVQWRDAMTQHGILDKTTVEELRVLPRSLMFACLWEHWHAKLRT